MTDALGVLFRLVGLNMPEPDVFACDYRKNLDFLGLSFPIGMTDLNTKSRIDASIEAEKFSGVITVWV